MVKANVSLFEVLHSIYAAKNCSQNGPNANEECQNEDNDGGVPSLLYESPNQSHPAMHTISASKSASREQAFLKGSRHLDSPNDR